ncbi:MAG: DUF1080 domain-containing protein [Flavobacteriales bacterium]|nr:MAG: DUF1080 domain-containing protein [Flavobacteriales bacterium]
MKNLAIFCLLLTFKMGAQDWTPLYNGNDIQGWEQFGDLDYTIEEGILNIKVGPGFLWCKVRELGNVTLRIVYSGAKKSMPGVFLRIPEVPSEAWMASSKDYEIMVDDKLLKKNSKNNQNTSKGKNNENDSEVWDVLEITLNGYRTMIKINDVLVADYTDGNAVRSKEAISGEGKGSMPESGYLAIQNLGKDDEIAIKEISYLDLAR